MKDIVLQDNEIIKDIPSYEGIYAITNYGRIWNYIKKEWKQPTIGNLGYKVINLGKNKRWKQHYIHKLLLNTYTINSNNYKCCNHKDGNKLNNQLNNLEWCSYSINNKHAYEKGLKKVTKNMKINCHNIGKKYGQTNGIKVGGKNKKLNLEDIKYIINQKGHITQKELGIKFNISATQIGLIWKNKIYKEYILANHRL